MKMLNVLSRAAFRICARKMHVLSGDPLPDFNLTICLLNTEFLL